MRSPLDWISEKLGKGQDMPDETPETPATEPAPFNEDELARQAKALLVARGEWPAEQQQAAPPIDPQNLIPGYDIVKPLGYETMEAEDQLAYVVRETRKQAVAEAQAQTKKDVESATSGVMKELKEMREQLSGTLAPVMRGQVEQKVAAHCSEEGKNYVGKALQEAEAKFNTKVGQLTENEAWLIAQRADNLAQQAKQAAAPSVQLGDDVPQAGANQAAVRWLHDMKKAAPDVAFTYEEAVTAVKEDMYA